MPAQPGALSDRMPTVTLEGPPPTQVRLGRSVTGTPIVMYIFGRNETHRPVFIFGGIHGDEPTAAAIARRLVQYLQWHDEAYRGRCVAVLPRANPDGLKNNRRENHRGVDLNRNFPAKNFKPDKPHGPHPASEPETRAILAAIETLRPGWIVSIHTCKRGRHGNNYDGPAEAIAKAMGRHNKFKTFGKWHNDTPGSFGNWAGVEQKIPVITLEIPNDLPPEKAWADNRRALLTAIQWNK